MKLFSFRKKQVQQPVDEKYIQAVWKNLLRAGNLMEIQDNAQSYIDDGYQGNADIYSIIRRHITMSTQARLCLKRKLSNGESEEVVGHDLNRFLINVNPRMTMDEFREAYAIYLLSTGNVFWYKPVLESGMNAGKTTEIYVLPSQDVEITQGGNNLTAPVEKYNLISSPTDFSPDEVYHSRYLNPDFYLEETLFGQSPIKAAKDILAKQIEAARTEAKQFENQGPAYMMFRDSAEMWNGLTDPQKTELEKEINSISKTGRQGGGKVLRDKFNLIKLGISPADLQIIESTQDGRRILCNVYQMPTELFNDPEGSTYNNVEAARKSAWTDALIPFNNKFVTDLNACLVAPVDEYVKGGYYYDIDYSSVEELQSGIKNKVEWMAKAKWTANEIRQATGVDIIEEDYMNQPIFSNSDVLGDEMTLDTSLENKNLGDYK
jgi:HK97 family phage portal protein